MPFGITASITAGLVSAGVGSATAGILAAGIVSAGTGALLGGGIAALTGGNIGKGALMGGIGGAFTGGGGALLSNLAPQTAASIGLAGASGAAGSGASNIGTALAGTGESALSGLPTDAAIDALGSNIGSGAANVGTNLANVAGNSAVSGIGAAAPSSGSWLSQAGQYVLDNPLKAAQIGNMGISAYDSIANNKNVDALRNANNAKAGTGFNDTLPKYSISNTATPYSGDWYTYGQTPQVPMYSAQLAPDPTNKYAHGGVVRGYARGGAAQVPAGIPSMPVPLGQPAQAAPGKVNPLETGAGFQIGQAIGHKLKATGQLQHLDNKENAMKVGQAIGAKLSNAIFKGEGLVSGGDGTGQSDDVDAKLSVGEFVVPADVVADLGDGSTKAGGKALDSMITSVRSHKSVKGMPPKAKNPLSYLSTKSAGA